MHFKKEDLPSVDVNIMNHFWVNGMSIDRAVNPSLKDYKMVALKKNVITYIKKDDADAAIEDNLDIQVLELLEKAKKEYQTETKQDQ